MKNEQNGIPNEFQLPTKKRKKRWDPIAMGKKGGKARFKMLSKEERSELGRMAVLRRWCKKKKFIA